MELSYVVTTGRRALIALLAASAVALAAPAIAQFPQKEVTIVVGFGAGGLADQGARLWATSASKALGAPVVVLNMPGSSGVLAANHVARSAPDGYTLNFFTPAPYIIQPHIATVPYDVESSFQPVISQYINPIVIAVRTESSINSLDDLIAQAKQSELSYSASAVAGIERFGAEKLQSAADIKFKLVPFNGSADSVTALLGGHVDMVVATLPDVKRYVDSGMLKLVVSFARDRKDLPGVDVPTALEQGYDAVTSTYGGLMAPKGIPEDVLARLHDAFKAGMEDPEFLEATGKLNMGMRYSDSAGFSKQILEDYRVNGELIEKLNLK